MPGYDTGSMRVRSHFSGSHADSNPTAMTDLDMDSTSHMIAFIITPKTTDAITQIGISIHNFAGSPTDDWKVSIQGVDSLYEPDGTVKGGGSPAECTIDLNTINGTSTPFIHWCTLDNSYTPSNPNEVLAIVIEHETGTDTSASSTWEIKYIQRNMDDAQVRMPQALTTTDGGTTWTVATGYPIVGMKTASKTYLNPIINGGSNSISNSSHKIGMSLTVPDDLGFDTYKIGQMWAWRGAQIGGTPATVTMELWDAGSLGSPGTPLASWTSYDDSNTSDSNALLMQGTDYSLNTGTEYYITWTHSTSASLRAGWVELEQAADDDACAFDDGNLDCKYVTYQGSWVKTATKLVPAEFYILPNFSSDETTPSASPMGMSYRSIHNGLHPIGEGISA